MTQVGTSRLFCKRAVSFPKRPLPCVHSQSSKSRQILLIVCDWLPSLCGYERQRSATSIKLISIDEMIGTLKAEGTDDI